MGNYRLLSILQRHLSEHSQADWRLVGVSVCVWPCHGLVTSHPGSAGTGSRPEVEDGWMGDSWFYASCLATSCLHYIKSDLISCDM